MTNDLLLTCALLLGGMTGAATARVAGAHPTLLIFPSLLALGLAVLPVPESLIAATGLTLLAVTISYCGFVHTAADPRPALGGGPALGLVGGIFALIAFSPLIGGLPGVAFAALIGLAAGLLSFARLDTLTQMIPVPSWVLWGVLTAVCFVIGATLHPGAGALAAALFLLFSAIAKGPSTPLLASTKDPR